MLLATTTRPVLMLFLFVSILGLVLLFRKKIVLRNLHRTKLYSFPNLSLGFFLKHFANFNLDIRTIYFYKKKECKRRKKN